MTPEQQAMAIHPKEFDVIVVGSGLQEVLVACSAVRSGKSVLVIDAVDTYGSECASFTFASLHQALGAQKQSDEPGGAEGAQQRDAAERASSPRHELQEPLPENVTLLPLNQDLLLPLTHISSSPPMLEGTGDTPSLPSERSYILDLAPKVLYQGEALVDLLVSAHAHHYLEFKLVDGSYMVIPQDVPATQTAATHQSSAVGCEDHALQQQPANSNMHDQGDQEANVSAHPAPLSLWPVPASRASIFTDRRLGLADKRALTRLLAAAIPGMAAVAAGAVQLQAALQSSTPLSQVLASERLPRLLTDVLLYGIAMARTAQAMEGPAVSADAACATSAAQLGQTSSTLLSAEAGSGAVRLYAQSMNRFTSNGAGSAATGGGAFMAPSYGCGSLAEALVRHAAVHGAVTVLRQPIQALMVIKASNTPEAGTSSSVQARRCCGIITNAGQQVSCSVLLASASTLQGLQGACIPAEAFQVESRALAITEASLAGMLPASSLAAAASGGSGTGASASLSSLQQQQLLTLVIPPATPGINNTQPVRVVQYGSTTGVCPHGRWLVYLSTPSGGASPQADLQAAVSALLSVAQPDASANSSSSTETGSKQSQRPHASHVYYYQQKLSAPHMPWQTGQSTHASTTQGGNHLADCVNSQAQGLGVPAGVLICGGVGAGMTGYVECVQAAEQLVREHLGPHGVQWLAAVPAAPTGTSHAADADGNADADGQPHEDGSKHDSQLSQHQAAHSHGADADDDGDDAIAALARVVKSLAVAGQQGL